MITRNTNKHRSRTGALRRLPLTAATIIVCSTTLAADQSASLTPEQRLRFESWRDTIAPQLIDNGITERFASRVTKTFQPDAMAYRKAKQAKVRQQNIGEFITSILSPERVRQTKRDLQTSTYRKVAATYGVPEAALAAIRNATPTSKAHKTVNALATLAALDLPRAEIWNRELTATLRIAEREKISLDTMRSAWNGTAGSTHLQPTTFEAFAQDQNGDGKADLWENATQDTVATAANALKYLGWQPPGPGDSWWGYEVQLPRDLDFSDVGLSHQNTGTQWLERGVARATSKPLPASESFSLLIPQGARGPAFLVTQNFQVVRRFVPSTSLAPDTTAYALAIALLGDAAAGHQAVQTAWRTVQQLTRSERMNLQELLVARGYDTGGIDGILGRKSVTAIRAEQRKRALPPDGFADRSILKTLQHHGLPHVGETE